MVSCYCCKAAVGQHERAVSCSFRSRSTKCPTMLISILRMMMGQLYDGCDSLNDGCRSMKENQHQGELTRRVILHVLNVALHVLNVALHVLNVALQPIL